MINSFRGRVLTDNEIVYLKCQFSEIKFIGKWIELLTENNLIGHEFSISEELDVSKLGIEMKVFTPEEQVDEAFSFHPGIEAIKEGFLPIGMCLAGSGDPYFLQIIDEYWNLVRVPHEAVNEDKLKKELVEYCCDLRQVIKDNVW